MGVFIVCADLSSSLRGVAHNVAYGTGQNGAIRRPLCMSCPPRGGDLANHASKLSDLRGARMLQAVSEHAFRHTELLGEVPRVEL